MVVMIVETKYGGKEILGYYKGENLAIKSLKERFYLTVVESSRRENEKNEIEYSIGNNSFYNKVIVRG